MIVVSATGQQQNLTDPNQIAMALSQGGTLLGANGQPLQGSVSGSPTQGADWTFNGQSLQQLINSQPATGGTTQPTQTTTGGTQQQNSGSPLSQTFDNQQQYTYNASPQQSSYTIPSGAFNNPAPYQGGAPSPAPFPTGYQQSNYNFPSGVTDPSGINVGYVQPTFNVSGPNSNQTLGSILQNFLNQGQLQAQGGQQSMSAMLQNMNNFGSGVQSQFSGALGLANQAMGQFPATMNWAGQAGTGDLQTQNALVQQLLGQTMSPLQGVFNQFQNNSGPLGSGPGLATSAQNMLNAIGGQLSNPITQSLGLMGQGLNPATSAALQTQAMDQTAQQYNNAKQATMTQLMNQGVMGGGAANPGGGEAQSLNDLGALSTAQQQQQSQLQQQAILANQSQLNQNNQMGLQAIGQTGNIANMFTGLQQQAAETGMQQILGASGLTGNLAEGLGGLYQQGALGFGNLTGNLYNEAMNYPLPYMNSEQSNLAQMLSGSQGLGQLGLQGVNSEVPFMNDIVALNNSGGWQSLASAGLSTLATLAGSV